MAGVQQGKSPKDLTKTERNEDGRFAVGNRGRPKGSKNRITIMKLMMEEAYRERNAEKIAEILDQVVEDALNGDKSARKLIWESQVSKAPNTEQKEAGGENPQILIKHMEVTKTEGGEVIDIEEGDFTEMESNDGTE